MPPAVSRRHLIDVPGIPDCVGGAKVYLPLQLRSAQVGAYPLPGLSTSTPTVSGATRTPTPTLTPTSLVALQTRTATPTPSVLSQTLTPTQTLPPGTSTRTPTATRAPTPTPALPSLRVVSESGRNSESGGTYHYVAVRLVNEGAATAYFPEVTVTYFDGSNRVMGVGRSYVRLTMLRSGEAGSTEVQSQPQSGWTRYELAATGATTSYST